MNKNQISSNRVEIDRFLKVFKKEVIKLFYSTEINRNMAEYVLLELLNNAFEHGNKKDKTKNIEIVSDVKGNRLTVSVEDEGDGFYCQIPEKPPPLHTLRGRGLWSVKEIVSTLDFNSKGNKVTVTFFNKEENMQVNENLFSVFDGRVIIVRSPDGVRIDGMSDKIVDFSTNKEVQNENTDLYLYIDLSAFTAVNSAFFGTLGATIQLPYVKQVALCGMREAVQKIAQRFGIVDGGVFKDGPTKEITDNAQKFRIFDSIEKAVLELVPEIN